MGFFVILDIEPTTDLSIIKKAYRAKLRITNPETNPEEFMKLRRAYEDAVIYAENHIEDDEAYDEYEDEYYDDEYDGEHEGSDEETNTLDEHAQQMYDWIGRVDKLYSDYARRNMVEEWIKVLEDDIPFRIEYYQTCRSYIFNRFFRAGHSLYLPREVRLYIDGFFDYSGTPLMRAKRRRFVWARTLNKKIKLCEKIEFDKLISDGIEVSRIDYFYAKYEQLIDELPEYEFNENLNGNIEEQLAFLKEIEVCYLPFECVYTAFYFNEYSEDEVNKRIRALTDRFGNAIEIGLLQAEYYIYKRQQDAAKELLTTLYKEAPLKNYVAIYQMAVCCLKVNMLYESYMLVKQLTWLNPKPFMNDMADMLCEKIESSYQDKLDRDVEITDIEHIHMCRMYLRSGREEDAVLVLKNVKNPEKNLWEYETAHMLCVMYEEAKFVKPFRNFVDFPPYDPIIPMEVKGVEEILKVLNAYPVEKCTPLDKLELKELKARYLFEQWRFDECEAMCNELLEEYPLSYPILMLRGYGDYCKNNKGYYNKSKNYIDLDFLINAMPKRIEARLICCLLMAFIKSTKRPLEVLEPVKEKLKDHYEYFEALKYLFSGDDNDIKYYLEGVAKLLKKSKEGQLTIPAVSKYKLLDMHNIFLEFCENTWVLKKDSEEEKACFEFLKSLISSEYNHPELYFDWYHFYVYNYKYENVIETLKSSLKNETLPSRVRRIYRRMAAAYGRMHDVENAEKYLAMVADDEKRHVYKFISRMYYDLDNYEKSIDYIKLIIENVSATIYKYWELGSSYKMLGKYEEAVQAFRDGIKTCSLTGDYGLRSNLYEEIYLIYEKTEEWDKALGALEEMRAKTRRDYFKNTRYHYLSGFVYWRQDVDNNNADRIIENWNKAMEGGLDMPIFYKRFAGVYGELGQGDKQLETLWKGIEICGPIGDYDGGNLYENIYNVHVEREEWDKALHANRLMREHSKLEKCNTINYYYNLGFVYWRIDNSGKTDNHRDITIDAWSKAIEAKADYGDIYLRLASIYRAMGDEEKAIETLWKGLEICGKSADYFTGGCSLYEELFDLYSKREQWDEATAVNEMMREHASSEVLKNNAYYDFKGFLLWRLDEDGSNTEGIIENWDKAVQLGTKNKYLYGRLAETYRSIGETDKAIETLYIGIRLFPENADYGDYDNLYVDLFWIYFKNREYEKGADIAKQIAEHTAIESLKKESLQRVALSSLFAEDYDTAYEYYVKVKEAEIYPRDMIESGQPDIDIFLCCYFMGRYEEAYTLAKSLAFDYGEERGSFMMTAIRSYFMAYGRFDEELVRRTIRHELASLEEDEGEDKAMTYCALAELYFILGDHEKVEEYKRKAYEGFENIESQYEYYLIIMESWFLGYQGRLSEAFEMYHTHENARSIENGNSDYAEYRFFRDARRENEKLIK